MSDQLTIEQAVQVLNEAKWRGRDDWHASLSGVSTNRIMPTDVLATEDAIAIAQSILDARALAEARERIGELEREVEITRQNARADCSNVMLAVEQLRAENTRLERRLERVPGIGYFTTAIGAGTWEEVLPAINALKAELAELRAERDALAVDNVDCVIVERAQKVHRLEQELAALRSAAQPFAKEARHIIACGLADHHKVGQVAVEHWRTLLAALGKQPGEGE